jgi:hypothetical protein
MPILLKHHYYVNKEPKKSLYINEIVPRENIEVSQRMFDQYEDKTVENVYLLMEEQLRVKTISQILETTGADV